MVIKQLIYVSSLAPEVEPDCLRDILKESMARNSEKHITGMMLYINGSFMQVLEGDAQSVDQLFRKKIELDARHHNVEVLLETQIGEPAFMHWSMGYANVSPSEMDHISAKNDFFTSGHCLTELTQKDIYSVLNEFREGKWRKSIS